MRIKVDLESDALYIRFSEAPVSESEEVSQGLIVDYDAKGNPVGLEVLSIKERFDLAELLRVNLDLPTGARV
jgi:uncharacterized protein YuzE